PPVAGGDEGDTGRQGIADDYGRRIRGPVVGDGDGVGEVLGGVDGGRPGLGDAQVRALVHHGRDPVGRGGAVVVGRVGVGGRSIGPRHVEHGAGRGGGDGDGAGQVGSVGEGRERRPGDDASRGGPAVAGGDESEAGRQRG